MLTTGRREAAKTRLREFSSSTDSDTLRWDCETALAVLDAYERVQALCERWEAGFRPRSLGLASQANYCSELRAALEGK